MQVYINKLKTESKGKMNRFLLIILFVCFLAGMLQQAEAQYYFGRNKVQYNHFEWHILETEHFDIYYYPQMRELAEIGAAYAEKTYLYLESKFNHNILRRVPLIFYATHAHFQETNTIPYIIPEGVGGFFEFLKGRVVVPANGSIPQFKHVLRHELVHVFTHSLEHRILKDHRLLNHPGLPLWFVEGLAEYWSIEWDTRAEMFIRDAVLSNYLYPLQNIYQINGSFLMYKEGQAALRFIAEKYGDEKLLELIQNLWIDKRFALVFEKTMGMDYKEFDKEWIYHLKKEYFPLLENHDSPKQIADQLTHKGINIKPTYFKHDEQEYVVFLSNRTGYANIYIEPIKKSKKEPKAEILVAGERSVEFESFHLLQSKIDAHSQGTLAFTSKSGDQDKLYIYDLIKREIMERHEFGNLVSIYSPTWSPDGGKIAFSGLAFSGKSDIYIYNRNNDSLMRLTDDYFDDKEPSWSPDGRYIAFSSDRGVFGEKNYYNLFIHDTETGLVRYVTNGKFNDSAPTWSPDGRFLAFSSDRNDAFNIWVLHPKSKNTPQKGKNPGGMFFSALNRNHALKQLTHFTTGAFDPEWTKDGDLLFYAFEDFGFQIYQLDSIAGKVRFRNQVDSLDQKHIAMNWSFKRLKGKNGAQGIKYKPKYDLDIAQSQITQDPIFGTSGGVQLAVTDMLGNYQYFFLLYNNARTRDEFLDSFNFAVSRVDLSRRTNFALGLYHFAGRYYNRYDYWFWERRYGGFGAISYPFSKFKRLEASLNVRHSDKEWFYDNYRRRALLVSNFLSYIKDTSLWGPTGPIDGERFNITLGNTLDIAHSNVNFSTLIVDYRRYFRLSNRVTHAVRLWTQMNHGKEATPFFMGGSWDLRGYKLWHLWGTKLALMSNELRFPFIDRFIVNFPFGGLGLSAIRGAMFVDVGNAWDDHLDYLLGSTGFGVRFRFGGFLVLRLDWGRKFTIHNPERFYRVDKYDVDNEWFTQFFFGWDF